ncbi:uncharacterized protein LOC106350558 [Brassica napus]|uniref:uncharacterized protein LOC106350558 n=1 Tax=Brassica napus TaxID=3708 RepID=UPI0020784D62|nr:uncharacterized protein LOC106350558 [Brassica napus]
MATKKAISKRYQFLRFLATIWVVDDDYEDNWVVSPWKSVTMLYISTLFERGNRDEAVWRQFSGLTVYIQMKVINRFSSYFSVLYSNLLHCLWRFFIFLNLMANNIRRALQDINLGADDAPFVLPSAVVRRAEEENRFILIGRPVMPRKQNLRAIVATMPRNWGFDGVVRGRIIEGRRFQFVFPTEEAMDTVSRRGPWAFADRMLVLQRWTPLMDMEMLNYIPFWIQIRGIPLQFMNRDVIVHIARTLGDYIQMDYSEENGGLMEYVRVRINWNVNQPLKFMRNFQFSPGVNTLLRLQYERLRGFCEECGLITHDSGACLIQNGGAGNAEEDDDSGDEAADPVMVPNQGVIIEEINENANVEQDENDMVEDQNVEANGQLEPVEADGHHGDVEEEPEDTTHEEYQRNIRTMEEEADDEYLWGGNGKHTLFPSGVDTDEMYDPLYPSGQRLLMSNEEESSLKRKAWITSATDNVRMFSKTKRGETSGEQTSKRKKMMTGESTEVCEGDGSELSVSDKERGAVGPEPPLPP